MQAQTKQAIAKLLYTKREALMEIKALQAEVKKQTETSKVTLTPTDESKRGKSSSPI